MSISRTAPLAAVTLLLVVATGPGQTVGGDTIGAKVSLGSGLDLAIFRATLSNPGVHSALSSALGAGNQCTSLRFQPVATGGRGQTAYLTTATFGGVSPLGFEALYFHAGHYPSIAHDRVSFRLFPATPSSASPGAVLESPLELEFLCAVIGTSDPAVSAALASAVRHHGVRFLTIASAPGGSFTACKLRVLGGSAAPPTQLFVVSAEYINSSRQFGPLQVSP